jgi:hypothetical protein
MKDTRYRVIVDEAIAFKIRELYPDLLLSKLVNDLLFQYILVTMEDRIPDALHPSLLRKVATQARTEHDDST